MIRTILYPTDLGLHGAFMLQHVVELAVRYDAKVIALHAVEPLGVFADAVLETYIPQDMIGDLRQYGMPAVMEAIRQQVIEAFEEDFIDLPVEPNRFSDVRVVCGAPADVILEQQKFTESLVAGGLVSEIKTDQDKEIAYQPARDINQFSIQYVLEALDKTGADFIPVAKNEDYQTLSDALNNFSDAMEKSPANKLGDLSHDRSLDD
ncbi:MAG: universal stress protein [Gammaproteobacteria bacterium]